MLELLAGIVVAVALLALVLEPLARGRHWAPAGDSADLDLDFTDIEESESPKVQALLAIKEIEFDRETGKLSDDDYTALKASYQKVALDAIKSEEIQAAARTESAAATATCPSCGTRPESSASFCSDCGQRLIAGGPLGCSACGEAAPAGAGFCGECGASLY